MAEGEYMQHEGGQIDHISLWKILSVIVAVVVAAGIIYLLLSGNSESNNSGNTTNTSGPTSSANKRNDQINNTPPSDPSEVSANSTLPVTTPIPDYKNYNNLHYNASENVPGSLGRSTSADSGGNSYPYNSYPYNTTNPPGNYPYNTPSGYPPDYYSSNTGMTGLNSQNNTNSTPPPFSGNDNFSNDKNRTNYPYSSTAYPATSSTPPAASDLSQLNKNRSGNSITSPTTPSPTGNPGLNNTIPYNQNHYSSASNTNRTMIEAELIQLKQLVDQYCSSGYDNFK